ncbi:MAG: Gx transporter family protein [Gammaproteobacteria bacterium]|nr:Gx transporter family protein [Gammaproteobacteria bacterium]
MTIATEQRRDILIARFAALAICIHLLEAAVPMPLPGVKPGLANVVILVALLRYDFSLAAQVLLLRVLGGSLLLGSFMTPTFWLSASGALASLLVLGAVHVLARDSVSAIGLGIAAAMAHMAGQVFAAWLVFVPHPGILYLLPLLLTIALGLGLATGIIAARLIEHLPPLEVASKPETA